MRYYTGKLGIVGLLLALCSLVILTILGRGKPEATRTPLLGEPIPTAQVIGLPPTTQHEKRDFRPSDAVDPTIAEVIHTALRKLVLDHSTAYHKSREYHRQYRFGFEWEKIHHYTEGRLLALCFPAEVEAALRELLRDPSKTKEDQVFIAHVLGVLASNSRPSAQELLAQLAMEKDQGIAHEAMDSLFASDREGAHRALYWSRCIEGVEVAFGLGPYWPDARTKEALERFAAECERSQPPRAASAYLTRKALERMMILDSEDGAHRLNEILSKRFDPRDRTSQVQEWQSWALRVARFRPTEATTSILRERLDRAESLASGPVQPGRPALTSVDMGYVQGTEDAFYDEVLLTYVAAGGIPNQTESQRLTYYGFMGDPKVRLKELLPTLKQ